MLRVYDAASRALVPIDEVTPGTIGWVDASDPTPAEIAQLVVGLELPESLVAHALDVDELARADHERDATLVVVRVPVTLGDGADGPSYDAAALGVLLRGDHLVTVSRARVAVVDDLARLPELPEREPRFVLRLLDRSAAAFLALLRAIEARVSVLEEQLQRSLRNAELHDLLRHQKALTHFHNALRSNEIMLDHLRRDPRFAATPEDEELMGDVVIELQQAIEVTRVASEILGQMMDAFASIVSNNLNSVMKVLTSLTIILALPTMIASFYGMNVGLPFGGSSAAFAGTVVASLVVSLVVAALFWWRRWL